MAGYILFVVILSGFALFALLRIVRRPGMRREDEKLRREQRDELVSRHQQDVTAALDENLSRDELLHRIARAAIGCTGALSACVFEATEPDKLQGTAVTGLFPPLRKLPKHLRGKPSRRSKLIEHILRSECLLRGEGVIGQVAANRRGELVADASTDKRIPNHDDPAARLRTMIAVPVQNGDRVDAVLAVSNSASGLPFNDEDLAAVKWIADKAAEVIAPG